MLWVIRERPKIDRIACPWLIRRLLDPDAVIRYGDHAIHKASTRSRQ